MNGRLRSGGDGGNGARSFESDTRFDALYDRYYRQVLAYCVRRLGRRGARAADDTFLVARRRIDDAPRADGALLWLYRIAGAIVAERTRAVPAGARSRRSPRRPNTAIDVPSVHRAEADRALEASQRLGERDREILRLATWERLPVAAIAALVGASEAVVELRLQRAGDRLAREYARLTERDRIRRERSGR